MPRRGSFIKAMPPRLLRIRDPEVTFLSLCPRGKNRIPVLYKAAQEPGQKGEIEFAAILKADALEERGEVWSIVYAPGLEDHDGHYATAEDILKMQRSHMRNGGKLDLRHDGRALTPAEAYLAESFIVEKGDQRFAGMKTEEGEPINEEGAWATKIQVESLDLRKQYREGKWGGVSLFGRAFLEPVTKEQSDAAEEVLRELARRLKGAPHPALTKEHEEDDMDEATLRRVLAEERTALLKEVETKITAAVEPLKPKLKKEQEKEDPDEPPAFLGSPTNPRHVKRHLQKMRAWNRRQEVDWEDPDAVEAHLESLIEKSRDDEEEEDDIPEFLREGPKRGPSARSGSSRKQGLKKERELMAAADRMAYYINGDDPEAED